MIYALIASNLAWAALAAFLVSRGLGFHSRSLALQDAREAARDQNHREHIERLENQIVLLKVSPITAAAVAGAEPPSDYLSLSDDEALAEFEIERAVK